MMSEEKKTLRPFERFSLTEDEFNRRVELHLSLNRSKPRVRSSNDLPFYDWEAAAIKRINDRCKGDFDALALVAGLMKLVDDDVRRRHVEETLRMVPKPARANTVGMFYSPASTLAEQSNAS